MRVNHTPEALVPPSPREGWCHGDHWQLGHHGREKDDAMQTIDTWDIMEEQAHIEIQTKNKDSNGASNPPLV